mmetsp:Transcript_60162/g.196527  ORF Transcript_60162/g.196527 Transcript_60162/m.196527 type:complete len:660 (-) Transcript_60162:245-2224(-)
MSGNVGSKKVEAAIRSGLASAPNAPWSSQQLYPRRWYDSILPINSPWDGRTSMQDETSTKDEAAVSKARARSRLAFKQLRHRNKMIGICLPTLIVGIPLCQQWLNPTELVVCDWSTDRMSRDAGKCLQRPDWRIGFFLTGIAFIVIKLMTIDFGRHFTQCIPDQLRGVGAAARPRMGSTICRGHHWAIPATHRRGLLGYVERVIALWHVVNTPVVVLASLWQYGLKFDTERLEVLKAAGGLMLVPRGDKDRIGGAFCCTFDTANELQHRSLIFFGPHSMILFMLGACAIVAGEIFKVRPLQRCVLKRLVDLQGLLNHTTSLRRSRFFMMLRDDVNRLRLSEKGNGDHGRVIVAGEGGEDEGVDALQDVGAKMEKIVTGASEQLHSLFHDEMCAMIHFADRKRLWWTAVLQSFGFVMWMPVALVYTRPCLGVDRGSASWQLFSRFHPQADLHLQCDVGVAAALVLIFIAGCVKLMRRYGSPRVSDFGSHIIFCYLFAYVLLMVDWGCWVFVVEGDWFGRADQHGGRAAIGLQHILIAGYFCEGLCRIIFELCHGSDLALAEVRDFEEQVLGQVNRLFDQVLSKISDKEAQMSIARWCSKLERAIEKEAMERIASYVESSTDEDWGSDDSAPVKSASAHREKNRAAAYATLVVDPNHTDLY